MQQGQELERGMSHVRNPSSGEPTEAHAHMALRRRPQPHVRDAQSTRRRTFPLQTGWRIRSFLKIHSSPKF